MSIKTVGFRKALLGAALSLGLAVLAFGDAIYVDEFADTGSGWEHKLNQAAGSWGYTEDGEYELAASFAGSAIFTAAPIDDLPEEFCLEVDARLLTGGALGKRGQVGVFVGGQPNGDQIDFTYAAFDPNEASIGLPAMYAGEYANYWYQRIAVNKGLITNTDLWPVLLYFEDPQFNHITLQVLDGEVTFGVNGMGPITFPAPDKGQIGFVLIADSESNLRARFDNVQVSDPNCEF
jgi:hypothetical protein